MAITALKAFHHLQPQRSMHTTGSYSGNDPFHQALQQAESQMGNSYETRPDMTQTDPLDYVRQLSGGIKQPGEDPASSSGLNMAQQLDMIKSLAQMQLMSLNQTLIDAFSGSSGSGSGMSFGMGNPLMSAMAGILQTVRNMQEMNAVPPSPRINNSVRVGIPEVPPEPIAVEPEREASEPPRILTEESQKSDAAAEVEKPAEPEVTVAEKPSGDRDIDEIIKDTAKKYGIDPNLVRAVVKTESNFDPKAVSVAGAMGLMQLMPKTAEGLGVDDAFDPVQNINGGAKYLSQMLNRYHGKIDHALAAYNWGPGNFDRSEGRYMPRETRNYIRIVNKHLKKYSALDVA